jgi:hypothetical protein
MSFIEAIGAFLHRFRYASIPCSAMVHLVESGGHAGRYGAAAIAGKTLIRDGIQGAGQSWKSVAIPGCRYVPPQNHAALDAAAHPLETVVWMDRWLLSTRRESDTAPNGYGA